MMSPKFLSVMLAAAGCAIFVSGPAAPADTGPAGTGVGATPAAQQNPGGLKQLSPESVAAYLRSKNHKVQTSKGADGRPIVLAHIQQNTWHFDIEIEFLPHLGSFYLICPLGKAGKQLSAAEAMALLKANH